MAVPETLNARIALAKGWTWQDVKWFAWHDPKDRLGTPPDYVGTLKGVAGLMKQMGSDWGWGWYFGSWVCFEKNHKTLDEGRELLVFFSPEDNPFHCVGDAWLSVFGEESNAGS